MMTHLKRFALSLTCLTLVHCAGRVLQHERAEEVLKLDEYDKQMNVKAEPVEPPKPAETAEVKPTKPEKKKKSGAKLKEKPKPAEPKVRQPELEDSEGMIGRRPIIDPFRVGEKVTLSMTYFNISAGTMDLEVKPFVQVNGAKAYQFEIGVKSNDFFSRIYAVDDRAVTYVSYEHMRPYNLQISIKESKQLAETRTFFDWDKLKATYWQKRITERDGERSKELQWDILEYSQNVISAGFYLRTFTYAVGKKMAFRVADEGKNIIFKGVVLRRETLKTEIGELDTWVIKPELTVDGVFTPVGDVMLWITADDRKFIVRIESKIRIGTIVAKLKSIEKGRD